ncbi:MAG: NifU family protein [Trueperaceae bacterium]|nr:NifU family protein [Trueperaceae bacterium]
MLTFTELAKERILKFLDLQRDQGVSALRIAGNLTEQKLWLVKAEDKQANDVVLSEEGFDIYLDPLSAQYLEDAQVDFIDDVMKSGFRVYKPSPHWDDPIAQQIQDLLDQQVNPGVSSHGGNISLEKYENGIAYLSMGGGCQGCASAQLTLRQGVEQMLRAAVPEITRVVDITDHASGENPYYSDSAQESPLSH